MPSMLSSFKPRDDVICIQNFLLKYLIVGTIEKIPCFVMKPSKKKKKRFLKDLRLGTLANSYEIHQNNVLRNCIS